jgi:DHA1 family tetracycline resistance protein-like MFS transporter
VWGRLSDRFGRKPLLLVSLGGAFLSYLILAFAGNLWLLALGRLMTGLMGGNVPLAMAYVSDVTAPEQRARSMGLVGASMSAGFIVGPMLGGLLGGTDASSATLLWPGLVAATLAGVALLGTFLGLRESLAADKRADAGQQAGGIAAFRQVFARAELAPLIVVGFLAYLAMALFEIIFPFWAGDRFAWGPRQIGFSFTYLALLVTVTQGVLVGRLVPAFGERRLLIAGLAVYIVGLLVMTQAPITAVMLVGITCTTVGGALYMTTITSLVSKQAQATERGLVLGTFNSAAWLGRSFAPPITGGLYDGRGGNLPLLAAAAIMLPCIAILARQRDRAAA